MKVFIHFAVLWCRLWFVFSCYTTNLLRGYYLLLPINDTQATHIRRQLVRFLLYLLPPPLTYILYAKQLNVSGNPVATKCQNNCKYSHTKPWLCSALNLEMIWLSLKIFYRILLGVQYTTLHGVVSNFLVLTYI